MSTERLNDLIYFYGLLERLEDQIGGRRTLTECHGRMDWPRRGVYFFFEEGETRAHSGAGYRVTRVGTHALKAGSKTTLWKRLSQHQGIQKTGRGNHRGSVFRLHVGKAMIEQNQLTGDYVNTWGIGSSASKEVRLIERPLEIAVSRYICAMPFIFLRIDDEPRRESLRGCIERNAIALLSNFGKSQVIDPPSEDWLGYCSPHPSIRNSGLWNVNHVAETYEPGFLKILEKLLFLD